MNNTIGTNIAKYRREVGMTQAELAEKMNVSVQAVSKWENDVSCPDLEKIWQLASILNTSAESILSGENSLAATKLSSDTDFSKRLLLIKVNVNNAESVDITLRIPIELIMRSREEGRLNTLLGEYGEQIPESVFEMIASGVVGPVVNINTENTNVSIEVVEYDR